MARPKKELASSSSWVQEMVSSIKIRQEEIEFRRENRFCQHCGDDSDYEVKTPTDTRYVCKQDIMPYCCMLTVHITKLKD